MKNIFFTGGNGFLGRNFISYAKKNYKIIAPSRNELDLIDSENVDNFFTNHSIDYIIHGAVIGGKRNSPFNPLKHFESNLHSFVNVFKHRHQVSRFIQLGSGSEYARPLSVSKIDENFFEKKIPKDDLGLAKFISSLMMKSIPPEKGVTLRLFGVFGPYEDYNIRFISNAITRTLFNLPIVINQDVVFDYLYVKDCIKIINMFLHKSPKYSDYNVGSGKPIRLTYLAEIIKNILKSSQPIFVKQSGLGHEYTCDNSRLLQFIDNDFKFTPIIDAIKDLCMWYESRISSLNVEWIKNPV